MTTSMSIPISQTLYDQARSAARAAHRTTAGQVEYWAKIGHTALDNPDLPIGFIVESLASLAEPREDDMPFRAEASAAMSYRLKQTRRFSRIYKALHGNVAAEVDAATDAIAEDPSVGERRQGDLAALFIYRLHSRNQCYLLGYAVHYDIRLVYLEAM